MMNFINKTKEFVIFFLRIYNLSMQMGFWKLVVIEFDLGMKLESLVLTDQHAVLNVYRGSVHTTRYIQGIWAVDQNK